MATQGCPPRDEGQAAEPVPEPEVLTSGVSGARTLIDGVRSIFVEGVAEQGAEQEGMLRLSLAKVHALSVHAAELEPLTPLDTVPEAWTEWLWQLDEALEAAQAAAREQLPDVATEIQGLRTQLDEAVRFEPGTALSVDADVVEAVAVRALRLSAQWLAAARRAS
jgi:hypothetical protein